MFRSVSKPTTRTATPSPGHRIALAVGRRPRWHLGQLKHHRPSPRGRAMFGKLRSEPQTHGHRRLGHFSADHRCGHEQPTSCNFRHSVMPTAITNTGDILTVSWTATDPDGDDIVDMKSWGAERRECFAADGLNPLPGVVHAAGRCVDRPCRPATVKHGPNRRRPALNIVNAAPVVDALLTAPSFSALHDVSVLLPTPTTWMAIKSVVDPSSVVSQRRIEQPVSTSETHSSTYLTRGEVWHAVVVVSDGTDSSEFTTPSRWSSSTPAERFHPVG